MDMWEEIYLTLANELEGVSSMPWIKEAFGNSQAYEDAWQSLADARNNLCQRFPRNMEDGDWEQIMNATLQIEKDMAKRMFLCGIAYAQKEHTPS